MSSENISLVLSDVMMPDINGFELCHRIKKDESTAHIPVLLLTALTDIKQQIHGISEGADGYIQKPFHINYLKVRIASLIEERRKWKKNFENLVKSQQKEDKRPDDMLTADELFLRQYMQKLELLYSDSDFGVERLSEELALSRGHLYRRVKELTGLSPVESLRNYRLEKALELLQQNKYTISEIAYNWLIENNFSVDFSLKVAECIRCHRYRGNNIPKTIEAKILYDSDKIDAAGLIGISRTLMYKGAINEPIYYVVNGKVQNGFDKTKESFFTEYIHKLYGYLDKLYISGNATLDKYLKEI